jgi:hypothetical protein
MPDTWAKRAPLTGIVAVLLFIIAFAIGGETPSSGDSAREVLDFYADNEGSQFAAALILAYGALFLVFFAGVLRAALRRSEAESGVLSAVAFGGGIMAAIGALAFASFTFALADTHDDIGPGAAQALNVLNTDFFLPVAVGTGVFMLAAGIAIVRGRMLPTWLGWAGIVIGVVAVTPAGFFGFLAMGLWVIVASVLMLRAEAPRAAAPPPAPPPAA